MVWAYYMCLSCHNDHTSIRVYWNLQATSIFYVYDWLFLVNQVLVKISTSTLGCVLSLYMAPLISFGIPLAPYCVSLQIV